MKIALDVTGGGVSVAIAFILMLGAAVPASAEEPAEAGVVHRVTAQDVIFQAAPVPDQDVDGPPDRSNPTTTLSPKLLSQKSLFQGDGYNYASSEQTTLDNRRAGVPGLRLSVPVK